MTDNQVRLILIKLEQLMLDAKRRADDTPKHRPEYADYHNGQMLAYQSAIDLIRRTRG